MSIKSVHVQLSSVIAIHVNKIEIIFNGLKYIHLCIFFVYFKYTRVQTYTMV